MSWTLAEWSPHGLYRHDEVLCASREVPPPNHLVKNGHSRHLWIFAYPQWLTAPNDTTTLTCNPGKRRILRQLVRRRFPKVYNIEQLNDMSYWTMSHRGFRGLHPLWEAIGTLESVAYPTRRWPGTCQAGSSLLALITHWLARMWWSCGRARSCWESEDPSTECSAHGHLDAADERTRGDANHPARSSWIPSHPHQSEWSYDSRSASGENGRSRLCCQGRSLARFAACDWQASWPSGRGKLKPGWEQTILGVPWPGIH